MPKALVISGANVRLMPYLFGYFKKLSELGYDITLVYWDRDGLEDRLPPSDVRSIKITMIMKNEIPKYRKIVNFLKFRFRVLSIMKKNKFDRIIACDTQFAVLISDVLKRHYKKRYIFDYRDLSFEKYRFYKARISSVIRNSLVSFVSSNAYRENLPNYKNIYTTHNITEDDLAYRNIRRSLERKKSPIIISYWGCIRETEINLMFVKGIANDQRFELHYYGTMGDTSKEIIAYCDSMKIYNVYVHGEYLPAEKCNFVRMTDIIHNVYTNVGGPNPAMGNKYYDGLIFYLPQICMEGGFMGSEADNNGIGIVINPWMSFADQIFDYYTTIDWETFEKKCDNTLTDILHQQELSNKVLHEALLSVGS